MKELHRDIARKTIRGGRNLGNSESFRFESFTWRYGQRGLHAPATAGDVRGHAAVIPGVPLGHFLDLQHSARQHRDSKRRRSRFTKIFY